MKLERHALPVLLAQWARAVDGFDRLASEQTPQVASSPVELEQWKTGYMEDLAVRHEIAQRIRVRPASAEVRDMLAEYDEIFTAATSAAADCVAGNCEAAAHGWTADREWYYWRDLRRSVELT